MVYFKDRYDAGLRLALLLEEYKAKKTVIYAIPRGGALIADPIATLLNAPMDLILAHKIGHPEYPEYAIAALSESGYIVSSANCKAPIDEEWLQSAIVKEMQEIKRKRENYFEGLTEPSLHNKIAIIVDDGIATGLTMQAGIEELKSYSPRKIIVAVPIIPRSTANLLQTMCDEVIAIDIPADFEFRGAVGAYYKNFDQVDDESVIATLQKHTLSRISL